MTTTMPTTDKTKKVADKKEKPAEKTNESMLGTLMVKRELLESIQTAMNDMAAATNRSTDASERANVKNDALLEKLFEKFQNPKMNDEPQADKDLADAVHNLTSMCIDIKKSNTKMDDSGEVINKNDMEKLTDQVKRLHMEVIKVKTENLQLHVKVDDLQTRYQNLASSMTTNISALRAGQATNSIQLGRTQDLTKLLDKDQPLSKDKVSYAAVTKNWTEVKRGRTKIQPQPMDDDENILTEMESVQYKSAYAECIRKKHLAPMTPLSSSTISSANKAILEKQAKDEEEGKTRRTDKNFIQEDDDERRGQLIEDAFTNNRRIIGFRPITLQSVEALVKQMETRGIFDDTHTRTYKRSKAMQTTVHNFMQRQLKMSDEDRRNIEISTIFFSTNLQPTTIYIECVTVEDSAMIYRHASNLPHHTPNSPQLDYFTPPQFYRRRTQIETLAWKIRTNSGGTIQTNIRQGRRDFILRQREKGSLIPWSQITPNIIPDTIAPFDIGKAPFKHDVNEEQIKEVPMVSQDLFNEVAGAVSRESSTKQTMRKRRRVATVSTQGSVPTFNPFLHLQNQPKDDPTINTEDDQDADDESGDESEISSMETNEGVDITAPKNPETVTDSQKVSNPANLENGASNIVF